MFNFIEVITCQIVNVVLKGLVLVKFKVLWWNWILAWVINKIFKTTWFLDHINMVRDIRDGQKLVRESFLILIIPYLTNWLICTSNLLMDWVKSIWDWIMTSTLFSKSIGSSFCWGGTRKGEYKSRFLKFCENYESIMFSIYF